MRISHHFAALTLAVLAFLAAPARAAVQTRTYQFTPNGTSTFHFSCGECAGSSGTLAEVAGTFTVEFDLATGLAALTALNDQLVNPLDIAYPSGLVSLPSPLPYGILEMYSPVPTLPWPGTVVDVAGSLRLMLNDPGAPGPGAIGGVPLFPLGGEGNFIVMAGNQAKFNALSPWIDAWTTVTDAPAVLIPEPSAWSQALAALLGLAALRTQLFGRVS